MEDAFQTHKNRCSFCSNVLKFERDKFSRAEIFKCDNKTCGGIAMQASFLDNYGKLAFSSQDNIADDAHLNCCFCGGELSSETDIGSGTKIFKCKKNVRFKCRGVVMKESDILPYANMKCPYCASPIRYVTNAWDVCSDERCGRIFLNPKALKK